MGNMDARQGETMNNSEAEQQNDADLRDLATTAALAHLRLSQSLSLAAVDAVGAFVSEQEFVEAARAAFRQADKAVNSSVAYYVRLARKQKAAETVPAAPTGETSAETAPAAPTIPEPSDEAGTGEGTGAAR